MTTGTNWHIPTPAVYLDQWVWVRLSRAHHKGDRPEHVTVLQAVREAAADGVLFPLSATHYEETLRLLDPGPRSRLAAVMASISAMCTIRNQTQLIRHQILTALHETVGRPLFRPPAPQVVGHGAIWALRGTQARLRVLGPDGQPLDFDRTWLRHANQHFEAAALAGPSDEEIPALRLDGYIHPLELENQPGSRLAWEELLADRLLNRQLSRDELRRALIARELSHEYSDVFNSILAEYRLTLNDITRTSDPKRCVGNAVDFSDRIPTMRIAAEMKFEVFRNAQRAWSTNMVRDIDALSLAIPYCHVVVADKDAAAIARRTHADARHTTQVISDLLALPDVLQDLRTEARATKVDTTGWAAVGPGTGYRTDQPPHLPDDLPPGCSVRLCDPDGQPVTDALRAMKKELTTPDDEYT